MFSYGHCRNCQECGKLECGLCKNCRNKSRVEIPVAVDPYGWLDGCEVIFIEPSTTENCYCGTDLIQFYGVSRNKQFDYLGYFVLCGESKNSPLIVAKCG